MSLPLVRNRFSAVAFAIETAPGVDAIGGTPSLSQWMGATCDVQWQQNSTPNNEFTGSLDQAPPIVGGLKAQLTFNFPLRGAGVAGSAPDFGRVLRCASMQETAIAAGVPSGSAVAAASGDAISAVMTGSFAATAQLYRGMPISITGGRSAMAGIVDYTAGKQATFGQTFSPVLGTTDNFRIPTNVLYAPTSDESVYKTGTTYLYKDGLRWRFTGFVGTPSISLTTGGTGTVQIQGMAQLAADPDVTPLPATALGIIRPTAPRFVAGLCQLNRQTAQARTLTFNLGVTTTLPDNPEALEGFDPAVPTNRDTAGTLDPYMNVGSYVSLFSNFRQGVSMPLQAMIGTVPGNRFLITVPNARVTQNNPGDRDGLATNQINFDADGPDAGLFVSAF